MKKCSAKLPKRTVLQTMERSYRKSRGTRSIRLVDRIKLRGGTFDRAGPCDVTKKEDLEKLVKEIGSKEQHVNLLGMLTFFH